MQNKSVTFSETGLRESRRAACLPGCLPQQMLGTLDFVTEARNLHKKLSFQDLTIISITFFEHNETRNITLSEVNY